MIVVIGDSLLDRDVIGEVTRVTPDAPAPVLEERELSTRPGGAALAALLLALDQHEVRLITALGTDRAGEELAAALARLGVEVVDLGLRTATPEKIRLRSQGTSLARWDRGGVANAADIGAWSAAAQATAQRAEAILVSCYGRGLSAHPGVRDALGEASRRVPIVWDPHPRGAPPVPGVTLATPNEPELAGLVPEVGGDTLEAVAARAERLVGRWRIGGVAVTRGARGALLSNGTCLPMLCPTSPTAGGDPCGAGDRFATTATAGLAAGHLPAEAVVAAVGAASRFVAAGGAAAVTGTDRAPATRRSAGARATDDGAEASRVVAAVRARGGTVVATGGCFDLVHAGHVQLLESARSLGDCLIVCLNSDRSVTRLKGPGRPIVPEADRRGLLRALACVDAVQVFDEDSPVAALRTLRPDVFVKGGDYGGATIPEAAVLASWGGQAVTLPYLAGRSTTRILEEVRTRDHDD